MHQIVLISLFSTSFDHFHFHGFLKIQTNGHTEKLSYLIIMIFNIEYDSFNDDSGDDYEEDDDDGNVIGEVLSE